MRFHYQRPTFLLSVGHSCIDLCQGAIPALLPTLLIQRHLSYTAAGGLVLAANIVSSVIQPLFGHFADRLRAPWLMPAGLLMAGSGLTLASLFSPYWLMALCVGISGVGIAAFHPEAARLMDELTSRQKATSMSIFALGGYIGFALGPLVMTVLLLFFGLRGTTALMLPLGSMALLLVFAFQPESATKKGEKMGKKRHLRNGSDHWWAFTRLTGAIICRSTIFYGLNTFLALYWMQGLHQSQAAGVMALSALLFAGLAGTLLGGQLADRYGRRRVVLLAQGMLFPLLLLIRVRQPCESVPCLGSPDSSRNLFVCPI
jgi:MFS transporter, FSR family, fosmidomycin resistance protein